MQIRSRAVVVAAFGVGPLLLAAGCGGSSATGSRATIANIQPTTYAEIPPVTTTTTTTLPENFEAPEGSRSPVEQVYTVQPNDGFGKIAALYDITVEQLINYNGFAGIETVILPGQQIKIPPDALVPGTASDTEAADGGSENDDGGDTDDASEAATGDGDCPTTYVIKAGDNTRIGVAEQFDITYQEMDAANTGTPGYQNFIPGTEIVIPCPS